jgi:tetraacyldisaccharide 4'-kinase
MHHFWRQLVTGQRQTWQERVLFSLLVPLSRVYGALLVVRARLYAAGIKTCKRLPRPVIAVGNLTVGGTGKTPTVLLIARTLQERGLRVAILTRGYGGTKEGETRIVTDGTKLFLTADEAGDEPILLASSLPGVMVVMGPDRYRAGMLAMATAAVDVFLLDDGFQHLRLHRDLNILLLDSADPFAGGKTLPAGLLREPVAAAGRADLVIYTRCAADWQPDPALVPGVPFVASSHLLTGWEPLTGGEVRPFADLQGKRVVAFAGIAAPAAFFDALEAAGVPLLATLAFPDHTRYGRIEMEALGRLKQAKMANSLITTAKDAVKLLPYRGILGDCLVARLELRLQDASPLTTALAALVARRN